MGIKARAFACLWKPEVSVDGWCSIFPIFKRDLNKVCALCYTPIIWKGPYVDRSWVGLYSTKCSICGVRNFVEYDRKWAKKPIYISTSKPPTGPAA